VLTEGGAQTGLKEPLDAVMQMSAEIAKKHTTLQ
jgi:hypothetical protein